MSVSKLQTAPAENRGDTLSEMNPVVWPEPSPLDEWWSRIMHGTTSKGGRR